MATTAQVNININAQSANKTVDQLNKSINAAGGSAASLKAELRKTVQELQSLQPGTARFQELSLRAGELRDQIADTNAVVGQLAGNLTERLVRGITGVVSVGVAGFQTLAAGAALFGSENEELQKTMVRLQALLNLSQAIETFAGLDQKLVEIRASFQSLTVATQAQTVATAEDAIVTEGAVVATTAWGTAMKALPIIAIVAALGTLVYGLYQYATANEEAEKQEEKRKKTLENLKKQEEERVKTIGKESGAYVGLITQLKATNAGSVEREKLIKSINTTYNTTLKNLTDEAAFQKQLNFEVASYIAYQRARFTLDKNQNLINENLSKQEESRTKIAKARAEAQELVDAGIRKSVGDALSYRQDLRETIAREEAALEAAEKRLLSYGKVSADVSKVIAEIEGTTGKYNTTLKDNSDSTKDATDANNAYDQILKQIQQTQEENKKQEDELYVKRLEIFDKTKDSIEEQQKLREEAAIKEFEAVRISIEKEVTEQKKKTELLRLNEANMTKYFQIENERRVLDIQASTLKIIDENKKRFEYLKLEEEALQKEIRFGDGNTSDTKLSLRKIELDNLAAYTEETLNMAKYQNRIDLEEYQRLLLERRDYLKQAAEVERDDKIAIAQADLERQLELEKARLEASGLLSVELVKNERGIYESRISIKEGEIKEIAALDKKVIDDKLLQFDIEIDNQQKKVDKELDTQKKGDELKTLNTLKAEQALFEQKVLIATNTSNALIQEEKNLNQASINLTEELATKQNQIWTDYTNGIVALEKKTDEEIYDEKIARFDDYLTYISNAVSEASNLISQFAKQQNDIATQQLNDQIALDRARIESQYAAALISREQFDNEIAQLEQRQQQDQLALDRKNFRTEKALSIAGATIDGARAVLGAFAGTQGGIIVRSLAAALAGVFAATQIALIARQEFKAATGGIVPGMGSGQIDSVPATLAPGEAVINSSSTQAFLPLLSAINEVGGGKSFVPDLPAVNEGQRFAPIFADNARDREPIRAYVVESDISTAQKRVNRIERSTKF
jgi:hypothetical protein